MGVNFKSNGREMLIIIKVVIKSMGFVDITGEGSFSNYNQSVILLFEF